jgi:DNA invertase Pin-like site-specific DNA recombinase
MSNSYLPPPSTLLPGSVCWAYLRDSGGPSQERSVDQQKNEIEQYCQRHNLTLALVFSDVARSGGSTTGRDQFNAMIDATTQITARPAGLLIWNYARFARDLDDSQYFKATLRKRGIIIHSITDPIPEGAYGQVVEIIIDIANQEKKRQTSRDAQRGLRQLVEQYRCVPGIPPRGFLRQPVELPARRDGSPRTGHQWVPDPEYKSRIQRAFQMRTAGSSLAQINAETKLFGSINSYRTFWNNKLYIGILEYGDLIIENYCTPIIDLATWNTVQKINERFTKHAHMQSDQDHPRRIASNHLLSGLIYCARCGAPLYSHISPKKNGKLEGYRCTRRTRRRDCDLPRLPASSLEQGIVTKLREILLDPAYYIEIYRAIQRRQSSRQDELSQRQKELQRDMFNLRHQIDNITAAIAERGHSRALLNRLETIESQEAEIKTAINQIKKTMGQALPSFTDQQLASRANKLAQLLIEGDQQTRRHVLHSLVQSIKMDRQENLLIGEIVIYFDPSPDGDNSNLLPGGNDPNSSRKPSSRGMRKSGFSVGAQTAARRFCF